MLNFFSVITVPVPSKPDNSEYIDLETTNDDDTTDLQQALRKNRPGIGSVKKQI